MPNFSRILKYNPYHDELGRFSSANKSKHFSPDVVSNVGRARHLEYARLAALRVHNKAKKEEPAISKVLTSMVKDPLKLDGFAFRMKTVKSLRDKVDRDSKFEHMKEEEAAAKIGDAVRYTVDAPPEQYTKTVTAVMKALEHEGHHVVKFKNYWGDRNSHGAAPIYQGINVQMVSKAGQKWELQFHTPQSYMTKENHNHKMFEKYRKLPPRGQRSSAEESVASELYLAMSANQAKVFIPEGVESLRY